MFELKELVDTLVRNSGGTWVKKTEYISFFRDKSANPPSLEFLLKKGDIVEHNGCITTRELADMEDDVAKGVMRLQYANPLKTYAFKDIRSSIAAFETEENEGRTLHSRQADAVFMAINNNFSILTGGPGTGKTTVISCIIYTMRRLLGKNINISLTAPSGKAAKVLHDSTGEHATTVHRGFEVTFTSRDGSTFYGDILFVDESSFIDIEIGSVIFNRMPDGKRVIFIGDVDQLPSVGPGAILRDLIASGCVPVTQLTHTFRQDNSSMLYRNIENIRKGLTDIVAGPDYFPILLKDEKDAIPVIQREYKKNVQKWGVNNTVVLVPYRKNGVCTMELNPLLQNSVNPSKSGYRYKGTFFKPDDLVMQLVNRDECVNGDIGKVIEVSKSGLTVQYTDCAVSYSPGEMEQLALAYSMTIHKSQGSEYKSVIMVLLDSHKASLNRNALFTGVTRAKKECTLIYMQDAYETAVKTVADAGRITFLKEKIQALHHQYAMVYGIV